MKILFITNVDSFFISHRLALAKKAISEGSKVYLICRVTSYQEMLESMGIEVIPVEFSRSGINPFSELLTLCHVIKAISHIRPDVSHMIAMKGVLYGGIACMLFNIKKRVFAISGLGYSFISKSLKARYVRFILKIFFKVIFSSKKSIVIFQNINDRDFFIKEKFIISDQAKLIRGAGVNLEDCFFKEERDNLIPVILFIGRIIKDKGVIEFLDAACIINENEHQAQFVLIGELDAGNPNALDKRVLDDYLENEFLSHYGHIKNVIPYIHSSNIVVLPSYREGLSKVLCEAAACGRAVITTDVPGCIDAIIPDITGLVVPKGSAVELAKAIEKLLYDEEKRKQMGLHGRRLAENDFSIDSIVNQHFAIYNSN